MKKIAIAFVFLFSLFRLSIYAQDCKQILSAGIYDISSAITTTERASAFINWFKSKEFSSFEEAKKYGATVGVPIEGIPVEFGFTADENGFKEFLKEVENYSFSSTTFRSKVERYVSKINQGVVDAWTKCVSQAGMHFWIEQSSDPKSFFVIGKYTDNGSNAKPKLTLFSFNDLKNIKINSDGPFLSKKGKLIPKEFTGAKSSQSFERIGDKSVTLAINATVGDGLNISFPALKKNTPYIRLFKTDKDKVKEGDKVKITWDVVNANQIVIEGLGFINQPQGDAEIVISEDKEINIYAYNDGGQSTEKIRIIAEKIYVNSIQVQFITTDDDKDWDTQPNVDVFSSDGTKVAHIDCCSADRDNDNWLKGSVQTRVMEMRVNKLLLKDMNHGSFIITRKPVGNDDWDMICKIILITSDGQRIEKASCQGRNICTKSW